MCAHFENYKQGSQGRAKHLKDEEDFPQQVRNETSPALSFVKPTGNDDAQLERTNLEQEQDYEVELVRALMSTLNSPDTPIIIAYDEHGGIADHVVPPIVDRWDLPYQPSSFHRSPSGSSLIIRSTKQCRLSPHASDAGAQTTYFAR